MSLTAEIVTTQTTLPLVEGEATVIPSGDVMLVISGTTEDEIRFDGRPKPVTKVGDRLVLALDFSRSTGFHHLHILPGHDFWLGTEDAKLKLDGVAEMLKYLREEGLDWSGQLFFSDGGELRDPHVIYGWLDLHADKILRAATEISIMPRKAMIREAMTTARGGKPLVIGKTLSLFRRRGTELLEKAEDGPIHTSSGSFHPRKAVVRTTRLGVDTPANRRVLWLTGQVRRLVADVQSHLTSGAEAVRVRAWLASSDRILYQSRLTPFLQTAALNRPMHTMASEETIDRRYSVIYEGFRAYVSSHGWTPQREIRNLYSYVDYVDEIYQAFVTVALGKQLGLKQKGTPLGSVQPAFANDEWELFYDCDAIPRDVLRSWRSYTHEPDTLRPDLLLHHKIDGTVLLGDAKYRNNKTRASESSRKDIAVYMAAYGASAALIVYPPDPPTHVGVNELSAYGRRIFELPLAPGPGLEAHLAEKLPGLVDAARFSPAWRG